MKHLSLYLIRYNSNLNNWGYDQFKSGYMDSVLHKVL